MTVQELTKILACPLCKGELIPTTAGDGLFCRPCALIYPIRDGVPIMLPEEASAATSDQARDISR